MASAAQTKEFISLVAPVIQKYAKENGYKVCSPIIAQACCESAYGTSMLGWKYHNYFGMKCGSSWKGKSVNMSTKEEYEVGTLTSIKANFRVYDSLDEGIRGYFTFISTQRYSNLKAASTAKEYLELIKADGYATSSTYVNTNMSIINKYDLTKYDNFNGSVQDVSIYYPAFTGTGNSIVDALRSLGIESSFSFRKKLAAKNGISGFSGTAEQNTQMLNLLKSGKLLKV